MTARKTPQPARINLRLWRRHRGLTLKDVAGAVGVAHSTVHRWESAANAVDLEILIALAALYGTTLEAMLGPPPEGGTPAQTHVEIPASDHAGRDTAAAADAADAATIRAGQAQRLRRLRQALDPGQADAARRAGVSTSAWNHWEMGNREIDTVALARWCNSHDVSADYVIRGRADALPHLVQRLMAVTEQLDQRQGAAATSNSDGSPKSRPR